MALARITFSPVNSQQRPDDCWSVMPFDSTLMEKSVFNAFWFSWFNASSLMLVPPMAFRNALSAAVF
jgi:hypothetical protein